MAATKAAQRPALSPAGKLTTGGAGNLGSTPLGLETGIGGAVIARIGTATLTGTELEFCRLRITERKASKPASETLTDLIPVVLSRRSSSVRALRAVRIKAGQLVRIFRSFSTYFPSKSNSKLTLSPTRRARILVKAKVVGISQTAKLSPSTSATVNDMPSMAILPL